MDGKINAITLISIIIFLVVLFRLRSVLGRRTGDDEARLRQRVEQSQTVKPAAGKVVAMPRRETEPVGQPAAQGVPVAEAITRIKTFPGAEPGVREGLLDILKLDPDFNPEHFVRGARQAYEMIVTAFAEGNRKILKDLLSREVYDGFVAAISERESRGEVMDQSFVGISKAEMLEANTRNGAANITMRFVSQLISATRDKAGAVVAGDPQKIAEVTDIWTFSRDLSSARGRSNPNWKLIATQAS
jgi:predicted lipid-binding transport protein (Tim44 family)